MHSILPFSISEFWYWLTSTVGKLGRFQAIPVVVITVLRLVVLIHLRREAHSGQRRGLVFLWVQRTGIRIPDLNSSSAAEINNRHIDWSGVAGYMARVASAPVGRWVGTVVFGKPRGKSAREKRLRLEFAAAGVMVSKQNEKLDPSKFLKGI